MYQSIRSLSHGKSRQSAVWFSMALFFVCAVEGFADEVSPEAISPEAAAIVAMLHFNQGEELMDRGDTRGAERQFDLGIISDPAAAYLYVARGQARFAQKKYQGAVEDFDVFLETEEPIGSILVLRGLAKSLLEPEDVAGCCADLLEAKNLGVDIEAMSGIKKYCAGQNGWEL